MNPKGFIYNRFPGYKEPRSTLLIIEPLKRFLFRNFYGFQIRSVLNRTFSSKSVLLYKTLIHKYSRLMLKMDCKLTIKQLLIVKNIAQNVLFSATLFLKMENSVTILFLV